MTIKEQITALPESDIYYESVAEVTSVPYYWATDLKVGDLKALADSHTQLLKAANNVRPHMMFGYDHEYVKDTYSQSLLMLQDAIVEAEKL